MHKYRLVSKKGEGTFSEVLKAQSIKSGKFVAIKCMKSNFDSIDQVNNLREIQALRRLTGHPHIIKLHEVLYDEPTGRLALAFELMDMNLYEAIKGRRHYLPEEKVKQYMYGLVKACDHMHRNGIFHRDVKPENLLIEEEVIKLADLGSCRGIYSRQPYTEYISTRWYRAPECLLTDGYYNFKMDLFAAGTVCFETIALFPLFPGQNETDQLQKIHNVLGTPPPELLRKFKLNAAHAEFSFPEKKGTGIERLVPHASPELLELMRKLLRYDPDERILARQALKDVFFRDLRDAEKDRHAVSAASAATSPSQGASAGARGREPAPAKALGVSASSSAASFVQDDGAAVHDGGVGNGGARSRSGSPGAEERGALPTIRQGQERGRQAGAARGDGSDGEEGGEGRMQLPRIGGIKGAHRKGSKPPAKGSRPQASAGQLVVLSNSKGFASTAGPASMASTGVMSKASASGQGWNQTGAMARSDSNGKWVQGQQASKFTSPFNAKVTRDARKH